MSLCNKIFKSVPRNRGVLHLSNSPREQYVACIGVANVTERNNKDRTMNGKTVILREGLIFLLLLLLMLMLAVGRMELTVGKSEVAIKN